MILRDLTDEQRKELVFKSDLWFKERNKGRVVSNPLDEASYMTGFSDGVRTILAKLEKLP